MPTISEIGERALVERFMRHMTVMPGMPVPLWDDVSAISLGDGRAVVLKTDMLVWKTDVPVGMTHFQAARKAVVMSFSDLGSKGVRPQAFLAALGAPGDLSVHAAEEMARGFDSGAREYGAYFVGGDTGEACDIIVTGMAYGLADERLLLRRGGAKPGDVLATTGPFGMIRRRLQDTHRGPRGARAAPQAPRRLSLHAQGDGRRRCSPRGFGRRDLIHGLE